MGQLRFEYFYDVLEDDSFDKLMEEHGKVISDVPKKLELPVEFISEYLISHEYLILVDSAHGNKFVVASGNKEHPNATFLYFFSCSKNLETFINTSPIPFPSAFRFVKLDFDMLVSILKGFGNQFDHLLIDNGVHGVILDTKEVFKAEERLKGLPQDDDLIREDEFAKLMNELDEESLRHPFRLDAQAEKRKEEALDRYLVTSKYLVALDVNCDDFPYYTSVPDQGFSRSLILFSSITEFESFVAKSRFHQAPLPESCRSFDATFDDIVYLMSESKYAMDSLVINPSHQNVSFSKEHILSLRDNKDKYLN